MTRVDPKVVDHVGESDDDSFMPMAPKKGLPPRAVSSDKVVVKSHLVLSDDDDFVLRGKRTVFTRSKATEGPLVVSNKRLVALSIRLRIHVPVLRPFKLPHTHVARQILDLILSKEFFDEHPQRLHLSFYFVLFFCVYRVPLFKYTPPSGDEFIVDAKYLITCFGPAGCINTELMDRSTSTTVHCKMACMARRMRLRRFSVHPPLDTLGTRRPIRTEQCSNLANRTVLFLQTR